MTTHIIIYHYTTISGLIGIITRSELWASDCKFLNDGTELSYARDMYSEEIKKLSLVPLNDNGSGYMVAGPSLDRIRMFITCFCENGDLLSQWRGYGADQGYSLGFNIEQLRSLNLGEITPVQYGIDDPSEYFADELEAATEPTAHPGVAEWSASEWLLPRLARVKHPGFAEEQEWRLLKQMPYYDQDGLVHFRPSTMGPVPYIIHSFSPQCLHDVVIGPGSYTSAREIAVRGMLQYCGFEDVNVRVSRIPFRR